MHPLFIGGLGATELLIILAVLVLMFGAAKLPELARGSGRALRIFKAETSDLTKHDDELGESVQPIVGDDLIHRDPVDVTLHPRRDTTL